MNFAKIRILFLFLLLNSLSCALFGKSLLIEYETYRYEKDKKIHSYSHPKVKIDEITISGNQLDYDKNSEIMRFKGNIVVRLPKIVLTASSADFDLKNLKNTLYNATMYDENNGIFGEAEIIEQLSNDKFIIHKGVMTTCKPGTKSWDLRSNRIVYLVDNFAYATGTSIHLQTIPVFVTPFLSWPTKKGRATGLLTPAFSNHTSSDETKYYGSRLKIPYFIVLDLDHDLTLTADIIQKRGLGIDLDYKYAFAPGLTGQFQAWYLDENEKDRNLNDETLGDLDQDNDSFDLRPERSKYIFDHKQNIFFGGQLFLHQHQNSDNEINKEFFDSDVLLESHFKQSVNLLFPWSTGSLTMAYETEDAFLYTSIYDKTTDYDVTNDAAGTYLNKHPSVTVSQRFANLFESPVSVKFSGSMTQYERKYGWNGQLGIGSATISSPFFLDFLNVLPSIQRKYYQYNVNYQLAPDEEDSSGEKSEADSFGWAIDKTNLELNLEVFRIFYDEEEVGTKKLSFRPRIIYEEVSDVDQSQGTVPDFIASTLSRKSLTYRLDSTLLTKNPTTENVRKAFQLNLIQILDLNSENCGTKETPSFCVENHSTETETDPGDQQLPLRIELILSPLERFNARLFYRYDHNDQKVIETIVGLSVSSPEGSTFSIDYNNNEKAYHDLDDTNHPAASIYTISNLLKIGDKTDFSLTGKWDQSRSDLSYRFADDPTKKRLNRQLTSLSATLRYKHNCYNFTSDYSEEIVERTHDGVLTEELEQKLTFTLSIPFLPINGESGVGELPYKHELFLN